MRIKRRLSRTDIQSQNLQESMDGIEASLGTLLRYLLAKGTQSSGAVTPVHKIKVREHFVPSSSFLYAVPDTSKQNRKKRCALEHSTSA